MDNSNQQREIVFCHQCENEWYKDEHGLTCPSCYSDFTEIVENIPPEDSPVDLPHNHEHFAPDPDEQDIENLQWEQTGPGTYRIRGTYRADIPLSPGQRPPVQGEARMQGNGLMSIIGSTLQGMLGAQQAQQNMQHMQQQQQGPQPQQQPPSQQPLSPERDMYDPPHPGLSPPNSPPRPASAPGSPPPRQQPGHNGPNIYHRHGPGYSFTIASSSSGPGNLFPRNPHGPQNFEPQPVNLEQMIGQIFGNIGAMPGSPNGMRAGTGPNNGAAPPHPFHNPGGFMGGPIFMGGVGGPDGQFHAHAGPMGPLANIFQLFGAAGMPPGGVAGDAVYSQEALDRIITQMMEQHQAGNAPGPATEAAIKALPTKTISTEDQGNNGKAECSICMDEVPLNDMVTVLPCQHWFHADCIRAWLSEHDTCPHCRQGIMPKDGPGSGSGSTAERPREPHEEALNDMRSPEYARPTNLPGAFPFPRQNSASGPSGMSGEGSQTNPYMVPESPGLGRRNSTGGDGGGDRRRSAGGGSGSGGGMFSRMRDAFGRSGSGSGGGNGSGSQG